MNLSDMTALVRQDLHDEDATNYRWTNDELSRHIARAVMEFSKDIPLEVKETLTTTGSPRSLDISSLTARVCIFAVEWPVEEYPPCYCRFSVFSDTLNLLTDAVPAAGEDVYLYYGRLHALDDEESTIPSHLENVVAAGAAAFALRQMAAYTLNRVSVGGEKTPQEFRAEADNLYDFFKKQVKLASYKNRIRTGRLYIPSRPPVNQSRDYGP